MNKQNEINTVKKSLQSSKSTIKSRKKYALSKRSYDEIRIKIPR